MRICSEKAEKIIQKHIDEIDDSEFDPLFRDAISQGCYHEVREELDYSFADSLLQKEKNHVKQGLLCYGAVLLPQYGSPAFACKCMDIEPTTPYARKRAINPTASAALRTVAQVCPVARATDANIAVRSRAALGAECKARGALGEVERRKGNKKQTADAVCFLFEFIG